MEKIASAGRQLGIEFYTEKDGQYLMLDCYDPNHSRLFTKRDTDLRLVERGKLNTNKYPQQYNFKGVDSDLFVVVVTGEALEILKAEKKAERAKEKAGIPVTRDAVFTDKKERLLWEAAGYFADGLIGQMNLAALRALNNGSSYWYEEGPKWARPKANATDEVHFEFPRRKLALNMLRSLREHSNYYGDVSKVYEDIQNVARKVGGVALPLTLQQMARDADLEIEARFPTAKPVSVETVAVEA
jgi:hypothetical protein